MKITRKRMVSFIAKTGGTAKWGKTAAGVVSLAILTGGIGVFWSQVQAGNTFKPGGTSSLQGLRSNQVMFPEENAAGGEANADRNENKRLEHDTDEKELQEGTKKEPQNESEWQEEPQTLLDIAQNVLILPGQTQDGAESMLPPDGWDGKNVQVYDGSSAAGGSSSGGGLPGYVVGETHGRSEGKGSGSGGAGETGTQPGGDTGNLEPEKPGTDVTPEPLPTPTPPPEPTPAPEPTPTPTPDPLPTPEPVEPSQPIVDPDYPDGSSQPELPKDFANGGLIASWPEYSEEGVPSESESDMDQEDVDLVVVDADTINMGSGEILYNGAVLTDWKILCSVYAYIDVGDQRYRLTKYSDCFKIGEYPKVVDGDFTVTFYYRRNPKCAWKTKDVTFYVKYGKVILMGEEDADGEREIVKTRFLEKNEPIMAVDQVEPLYRQNPDWGELFFPELSMILPGVSLSEDGSAPITDRYLPKKGGRYTLYPLERTPVPEGMSVYLFPGLDERDKYVYKQTVVGFAKGAETVSIPEGIFSIQMIEGDGTTEILELPSSVQEISMPASSVERGYNISEANRFYCTENGQLFNKEQTELLAVPWLEEEVTVPASVRSITLEEGNSIKTLILNTETIPELDLNALDGAKILVPEHLYKAYQLVWGSRLGNNTLGVKEGKTEETVFENNALLSSDRTILYGISSDAYGFYEVPDGVETLKEDATDYCTLEDGLCIPKSVKKLEKGSLAGAGIHTIYWMGDRPPAIEEGTFGDLDEAIARGLQIIVPSDSRDLWIEAWSPVLGEYADFLIQGMDISVVKEENGLRYLTTDRGAVLLHAPAGTKQFEDLGTVSGKDWIRIGARAFEDCQELQVIELPATVAEIGSGAFYACDNLEMVLSLCESSVTVGGKPFPDDATVAFNAERLDLEDGTTPDAILMYVIKKCSIYADDCDSDIWTAGDRYELVGAETAGTILYGLDLQAEEEAAYLIKATKDLEGEIRIPAGYLLREVIWTACRDCKEPFSIPDEAVEELLAVGTAAFENSGLAGSLKFSPACFLIDDNAFSGCKNLTGVSFDGDTERRPGALNLGLTAFSDSGLETIQFGENLQALEANVFMGCENLRTVTFQGENPPMLTCFYGAAYTFGWEKSENKPELILENADAEIFVEAWKYSLVGYGSYKEMKEAQKAEALWDAMSEWPADQIWGEDGQPSEGISGYADAYAEAVCKKLTYEGERKACILLGLPEPEEPEITYPDKKDYIEELAEELPPFELLPPEEIFSPVEVTEPDLVELPDVETPDEGVLEPSEPPEEGEDSSEIIQEPSRDTDDGKEETGEKGDRNDTEKETDPSDGTDEIGGSTGEDSSEDEKEPSSDEKKDDGGEDGASDKTEEGGGSSGKDASEEGKDSSSGDGKDGGDADGREEGKSDETEEPGGDTDKDSSEEGKEPSSDGGKDGEDVGESEAGTSTGTKEDSSHEGKEPSAGGGNAEESGAGTAAGTGETADRDSSNGTKESPTKGESASGKDGTADGDSMDGTE